MELIPSNDGKIKAAKILLAMENTANRSLNVLFPIECNNENEDATIVDMRKNNETIHSPNDNNQKLTDEEFVREKRNQLEEVHKRQLSTWETKFALAV